MGYCPECGNTEPKPLMAKLCLYHYNLSKPKKPIARKPVKIKPVADKRAKEIAQYRIERDKFLKENDTCMFPGCGRTENLDLHHASGRSGNMIFNNKYFRVLCREHHEFCEGAPEEAKRLGLSVNRLDK